MTARIIVDGLQHWTDSYVFTEMGPGVELRVEGSIVEARTAKGIARAGRRDLIEFDTKSGTLKIQGQDPFVPRHQGSDGPMGPGPSSVPGHVRPVAKPVSIKLPKAKKPVDGE